MDIKLNLNWTISHDEVLDIDPVLFNLLESIQQQGSLKKATEQTGVSYRFAWGLFGKWDKLLGQPLIILERGRGATLSVLGEKLLNANNQLLAQFSPGLDNFATQFKQEFESALTAAKTPSLNIFASHGLAISTLRDLINQQDNFKLDLHFHGSLRSLRALQNGDCDIAGFHIPEGSIAKDLIPKYLEMLSPNKHQLLYVVKRNQGLMFQSGNPNKITDLHSLINDNISFINRQVDSGTRLLFDQLLHVENIVPSQIKGYQHEEFTHMAVAAMIASGVADVGFGIAPIAAKFNLEFIPLIWEHYCLAIPKNIGTDDRVTKIISLMQGEYFKQTLSGAPGYDTSQSGAIVSFKEIFG